MNAVVGLQATVDANNHITRIGVTCALCHSTVDNSVVPGIGRRKDGWPREALETIRQEQEGDVTQLRRRAPPVRKLGPQPTWRLTQEWMRYAPPWTG
jgi:hypothetical protein